MNFKVLKMISRIFKNRFYRKMEPYDVNLEELKNMQKSGAEIIDVRSKTEYDEGHLEGAINIPEYELKSNFKNLNIDKNKVIVLYCISGSRSKRAYFKLKQMGYSQVYNLYGGLEEY